MKKITFTLCAFSCIAVHAMENGSTWQPWGPRDYAKHSKPQQEASMRYYQGQLSRSNNTLKKIVDLGCNAGQVTRQLAAQNPDIRFYGIDPESEAIQYATKNYNGNNAQFVLGTAQNFTLPDGIKADLIGYHHAHHWVPKEDNQKTFNNIAKNLAPGGILDLNSSCKNQTDTGLVKALLWTVATEKKWDGYLPKPRWWAYIPAITKAYYKYKTHLNLLTREQMVIFALDAGLHVESCKEVDFVAKFDSKEEFAPWVDQLLKPHGIETIFGDDKETRKAFVDSVVETYLASYNKAATGIGYTAKTVHLVARKPEKNKHPIYK